MSNKRTGVMARRDFVAGAAAATFTLVHPSRIRGTAANSILELGMIGCGGRGNWIANLFVKEGKCRFVACADYFEDRVDRFGGRFQIDPGRRHTTLSGYKKVVEGKLDAVVIETPPYCHPEQAAAAVDAGKHVFLAKPIAVDVPGCRLVADAGRKATAKKLVYLVDFQTRNNPFYREAARRVSRGEIGRLMCGEARYPWAGGRMPAPKDPEDRLRRWYCTRALSGDFIVEQSIHSLDVATWFLDADPVLAYGRGGSKGLRGHGDIWDHFSAIYQFPESVVLSFQAFQAVPGTPDAIHCRVCGSEGLVDTDYFSHVWIRGKKPYEGSKLDNLYTTGAVNNIRDFHRFITEGHYENETVAPSVRSNLTCILGRNAAYEKREVTWESMMRANVRLEPNLEGLKA